MADDWRSLPRIRRPRYTDQDVRAKTLELRDALVANLDFIEECITEDLDRLRTYKERFGDLRYRTIVSEGSKDSETVYGSPTHINLEPLASQLRATINSLLQSVNLIQDKIAGVDDPEGSTSLPSTRLAQSSDRVSSRDALRAAFLAQAEQSSLPVQPMDEDPYQDDTKLVETAKAKPRTLISPTPDNKPQAQPKVIPHETNRKPWRETTARAVAKAKPIEPDTNELQSNTPVEENQKSESKPLDPSSVGLSPLLRQRLQMQGNGLAGIRDKYRSGDTVKRKPGQDEEQG